MTVVPSPQRELAFDRIVDLLVDAVIAIDAEHRILFANKATSRLFGYAVGELMGMCLMELIPQRLRDRHVQGMARYLAQGGQRSGPSDYFNVLGLRADGVEIPLSLSMTYTVIDGQPLVTGLLRDLHELVTARREIEQKVLELEALNIQLARQAERDPLTGAYNRRALGRLLDELWADRSGLPVSVALCDIDHFKGYNDHYGHLEGDRCLTAVAQVLEAVLAPLGGHLVRFGGEEFLALLPGMDAADALLASERMRTALTERALVHAASPVAPFVSLSVGVATAIPETLEATLLLRRADDALYFAKRYRNRVHAWQPSASPI